MACKVTATAKSGKYRIETEYVTDPGREHGADAGHVRAEAEPGYRLYVRFDPTVNGNGGGGAGNGGADSATVDGSTGHPVLVSSDPVTATNAANRDYAQPVYAALDGAFSEASSGFAGAASDGLVQLDASHALTPTYDDARGRQRRPDRAGRARATTARRCSRSASAPPRPRRSARPRARSARTFDKALARLQEGLEGATTTR